MASLTSAVTLIVGVLAVGFLFLYCNQDPGAVAEWLKGNWQPFILAVQIIAAFALTITHHRLAGGILVFTSVLTIFGVIA